ncbi:hypothetical protein Hanom_Chr16g01432891 [Helianthus anomalus]
MPMFHLILTLIIILTRIFTRITNRVIRVFLLLLIQTQFQTPICRKIHRRRSSGDADLGVEVLAVADLGAEVLAVTGDQEPKGVWVTGRRSAVKTHHHR